MTAMPPPPPGLEGYECVPDEGCIFIHTASEAGRLLPGWVTLLIAHGPERELFAAAVSAPPGEEAALAAARDDPATVNVVLHEGHPYLPVDFLERAFPEMAGVCDGMRRAARIALGGRR